MSKSLDFCVSVASNSERSSFCNRNWEEAYEFNSPIVFDADLRGERNWVVTGHDDTGDEISIRVELAFNPNADFQYFTSESCLHDGTLIHIGSLMEKCVAKVCCLGTYYQPLGEPRNGQTVKIEVGNFVILNEFDKGGDQFTPEDKKWMRERTTVLLPLRMEYMK